MKYTPIRRIRQTRGSGDESSLRHQQMGRRKVAYTRIVCHEIRVRLALSKPEQRKGADMSLAL
jgi:hypothetical protein